MNLEPLSDFDLCMGEQAPSGHHTVSLLHPSSFQLEGVVCFDWGFGDVVLPIGTFTMG